MWSTCFVAAEVTKATTILDMSTDVRSLIPEPPFLSSQHLYQYSCSWGTDLSYCILMQLQKRWNQLSDNLRLTIPTCLRKSTERFTVSKTCQMFEDDFTMSFNWLLECHNTFLTLSNYRLWLLRFNYYRYFYWWGGFCLSQWLWPLHMTDGSPICSDFFNASSNSAIKWAGRVSPYSCCPPLLQHSLQV